MKIYRLAQISQISDTKEDIEYPIEYPMAGSEVSGLRVDNDIPNTNSIGSSMNNYTIIDGIREVPLSEFHLTGKSYSPQETSRIQELSQEIKKNGYIKPLIVVIDAEGPYILEGGHRAEAMFLLGFDSFPALVVKDEDI